MRITLFIIAALLAGCAITPDPIDQLVTSLSSTNGMWVNGAGPVIGLPETASTEQVIQRVFELDRSSGGQVTDYKILEVREVRMQTGSLALYTVVLARTNLGRKIVFLRWRAVDWWFKVYDANPSA